MVVILVVDVGDGILTLGVLFAKSVAFKAMLLKNATIVLMLSLFHLIVSMEQPRNVHLVLNHILPLLLWLLQVLNHLLQIGGTQTLVLRISHIRF